MTVKKRLLALLLALVALPLLAGCPADDCTHIGDKKYHSDGSVERCEQRSYESRPHWHQIEPPR